MRFDDQMWGREKKAPKVGAQRRCDMELIVLMTAGSWSRRLPCNNNNVHLSCAHQCSHDTY